MKKLSLALAALLVLTMFASCKKTGDDPKTSGSSSSEPTSSSVKDSTEPDSTSAPAQTSKPNDETKPPETSKNEDPAPTQNTTTPEQTEYEIPKAAKAPVIDGKFDADEWKGALEVKLDNTNTVDVMTSGLVCQGGTFRYLWDEKGLYVSMEINDSVLCDRKNVAGSGDYNNLDGAQIACYIDPNCTNGEVGKMFFFSLCPRLLTARHTSANTSSMAMATTVRTFLMQQSLRLRPKPATSSSAVSTLLHLLREISR